MNTLPGTAIGRYSNHSCRLPVWNRYDCIFIQEFPCCSIVRNCNTAIMKTYGLIQFRISSVLFMYPHPTDLSSFIILRSMSLTRTYLRRVKGAYEGVPMYSTHSLGTSRRFCPRAKHYWHALRRGLVGPENRRGHFRE